MTLMIKLIERIGDWMAGRKKKPFIKMTVVMKGSLAKRFARCAKVEGVNINLLLKKYIDRGMRYDLQTCLMQRPEDTK
jgi:hypothetical protein